MSVLITPPLAFMVILAALFVFSVLVFGWAYARGKERESAAYSCGEDFKEHLIQPDYSQFFPFAFFFTILHVVAMVVATVPVESKLIFAIAVIYVLMAVIGMFALLRKD